MVKKFFHLKFWGNYSLFFFPKKLQSLEVPVLEAITMMMMGMLVGMVGAVTVKVQMAVPMVKVQTVEVQMVMDQVEAIPVRTGVAYRPYQELIPKQN